MNTQHPDHNLPNENESLNLKVIFEKYIRYWKWIVLSVIVSLGIAYLYLRYTHTVYETSAKLLIEDNKDQGASASSLSIFKDLGILSNTSSLENEIEILKSRSLATKVALNLNLQTCYFDDNSRTGLKNQELFLTQPVNLIILDSINTNQPIVFELDIQDEQSVLLSYTVGDGNESDERNITFDKPVKFPFGTVLFQKTAHFKKRDPRGDYNISYSNLNATANQLLKALSVQSVNKDASVLSLSIQGVVPEKNEAILNEWIQQHEIDKLQDKQEVTKKTSTFINERMKIITSELSDVDNKNLTFKKDNKLVDLQANAQESMGKEASVEKEIIGIGIQLEISKLVSNYLDNQVQKFEVLPSNLGLEDQSIGQMIGLYNELVLKRSKLVQNSTSKNPLVKDAEEQILAVRTSLKTSLKNVERAYEVQLKSLKDKERLYNQQLSLFPNYEKEFRDIQREQQIKETLYLYLLQKREENEIASAANITNIKVIDYAYTNSIPVSPKRSIILLAAFIIGLIIPVSIIYILQLFDTKVKSPKDIEDYQLTFIGSIPKNDLPEEIVATNNSRAPISEAFRILRTNVSFMMDLNKKGGVLFVTSTIASEGKTFVSSNLAHSLAITGKKVVLVGLDLRAPKLGARFNLGESKGVSTFLADENVELKDLIHHQVLNENLDIITAGPIPPNPSELLMRKRFEQFINELKEMYDHIIIDTAPSSNVADTIIVNRFADLTVYIVRAGKMDKRMLQIPGDLIRTEKLKNVGIVLNCAELSQSTYGYGYGYGYGAKS